MSSTLEQLIDDAFERRASLASDEIRERVEPAVEEALGLLESGTRRVAERNGEGVWQVQQWLKKAVLLSFRLRGNQLMAGAPAPYYDKVPLKYADWDEAAFRDGGARVVPGAIVRRGDGHALGQVDAGAAAHGDQPVALATAIGRDRGAHRGLGRVAGRLVEHRHGHAGQGVQRFLQHARGFHARVGHDQRARDAHALALLLEQLDGAVFELDLGNVVDEGHGKAGFKG